MKKQRISRLAVLLMVVMAFPVSVRAYTPVSLNDLDEALALTGADLIDTNDSNRLLMPSLARDYEFTVAHTWYVAKDGSNSNAGKSLQKPFRTIGHALRQAGPNDRIVIRGGLYKSNLLPVRDSGLTIKPYKNERVIIEPKNPESQEYNDAIGMELQGDLRDIIVKGLTFRGFSRAGIVYGDPGTQELIRIIGVTIDGSAEGIVNAYPNHDAYLVSGLRIHNTTITNASAIGITCGDENSPCAENVFVSDVVVVGTNVDGENSGADAIAFTQSDNILVYRTRVRRFSADGMDFKATNVSVINSTIKNVGRNGLKFWNGGQATNVIVDNTGADSAVVFDGAGDYRLENCSITRHLHRDGGASYAMTVGYDQPNTAITVEIMNTIFHDMPGPIYFSPGTEPFVMDSLFSNFDEGVIIEHGNTAYHTIAEIAQADWAYGTNIGKAPQFRNLDGGNFHLKTTSPAIDAGTNVVDLFLNFDRSGALRHQGTAVDIGPYEQ